MSLVLAHATRRPIVKITRAATTLALTRQLCAEVLAELRFDDRWCFPAITGADVPLIVSICDALDTLNGFTRADVFAARDELPLAQEEALTTRDGSSKPFNRGAHALRIIDRAQRLDGAYIEYFRRIANPIGIGVGPNLPPRELARLVEALNPEREPGRITLITRYGAHQIERQLPAHIEAVRAAGMRALWSCDPIHGNAPAGAHGTKARDVETIATELELASQIHRAQGSRLGGVHLETTCQALAQQSLVCSHTGGDSPLSRAQALALLFRLARLSLLRWA
jgi:3-deoxy-7-phosphoheptulonate synthase